MPRASRLIDQIRDQFDASPINKVGVELEGGWNQIPDGCHLQHDGSVSVADIAHVGEIVSQPMNLEEILSWMNLCYPQKTNATCGLHVHVSVKNTLHYSRLMDREFHQYFFKKMKEWGERIRVNKASAFWKRLAGNNSFARRTNIDPDAQASVRGKDGVRYRLLNFCWRLHGTMEMRLLPAFQKKELAMSAVKEEVILVEKYLSAFGRTEDNNWGNVIELAPHEVFDETPIMEELSIDDPPVLVTFKDASGKWVSNAPKSKKNGRLLTCWQADEEANVFDIGRSMDAVHQNPLFSELMRINRESAHDVYDSRYYLERILCRCGSLPSPHNAVACHVTGHVPVGTHSLAEQVQCPCLRNYVRRDHNVGEHFDYFISRNSNVFLSDLPEVNIHVENEDGTTDVPSHINCTCRRLPLRQGGFRPLRNGCRMHDHRLNPNAEVPVSARELRRRRRAARDAREQTSAQVHSMGTSFAYSVTEIRARGNEMPPERNFIRVPMIVDEIADFSSRPTINDGRICNCNHGSVHPFSSTCEQIGVNRCDCEAYSFIHIRNDGSCHQSWVNPLENTEAILNRIRSHSLENSSSIQGCTCSVINGLHHGIHQRAEGCREIGARYCDCNRANYVHRRDFSSSCPAWVEPVEPPEIEDEGEGSDGGHV